MKKIIVLGSPGSGKSTFSRNLRDLTDIPLHHLDMIWHKPDKTNIPREEFDRILDKIMQEELWIIDGNYSRTIPRRLEKCDTVFLLDFPLEVCLDGVKERIGKKRPDMPWTEQEFDEEFKKWIMDFPNDQLPKIYEMLEEYKKTKNIIIFKSRKEADNFLERLKKSL